MESRGRPLSDRYRSLLGLHQQMHAMGQSEAATAGTSPKSFFLGFSLLPHVERIKTLIDRSGARTLLDYGAGKGLQYGRLDDPDHQRALPAAARGRTSVLDYWGVEGVTLYDPAYPPFSRLPAGRFDGVVCTDVLEHCPEEDLPWIVEELCFLARRFLFVHVACVPARKTLPNGENCHSTVRPASWWFGLFQPIGAAHPHLRIVLVCSGERSLETMTKVDLNEFPRRKLGVEEHREGDQLTLRVGKQSLVQLNASAEQVWRLCDGNRSVKGIAHSIGTEIGALGMALFEPVGEAVSELERVGALALEQRDLPPVRVFVGTEPRMTKAEAALEYSTRLNTTGPVEMVWMDHGRGGIWGDWNIGRERGKLSRSPDPSAWATEFSCFRFAIPEASGFSGRSIYLDVDMLVLGDLRTLVEAPLVRPVVATETGIALLVFDCERFSEPTWWPRLAQMKPSGWSLDHYVGLLREHGWLTAGLSRDYNCLDGDGFVAGRTVVLHYTQRNTQPWKPHPEVFDYPPHQSAELEGLWQEIYRRAESQAASRVAD